MASPELVPSIEIVDEDPRTPKAKTIDLADTHDWQQRAYQAEQELGVERSKLERERRKSRRSQGQINEYIEALAWSTQNYNQMTNQCHLLSNTNLGLAQELRKAKVMVETLEAVIMMLYEFSANRDVCNGSSIAKRRLSVDKNAKH